MREQRRSARREKATGEKDENKSKGVVEKDRSTSPKSEKQLLRNGTE
ncbi:hypothetical protein TGMAS_356360, partial [Toxoplasma gondii MAS]